MAKKILNEAFNIKNGQIKTKDGRLRKIAYIDQATSENTFNAKDIFKKYKAYYRSDMKTWVWYLGDNPQMIYQNYIQPCLEELTKIEDKGQGTRQGQVTQIIDKLIKELSGNVASIDIPTAKNVTEALIQFKQDLMNCTSSEEFKKRMEPIIKFNQSIGHRYSFANSLLIWLQDPEATMVKSPTAWAKMNRIVTDKTSKPILLWRPDKEPLTKQQRDSIRRNYLAAVGVKSVNELNPGQKEELNIQLSGGKFKQNANGGNMYKTYLAYDVRFTQQIEGKEDLVGSKENIDDIKWFSDDNSQNEHLTACIEAGLEVIQDAGVKIEYETREQMGGALGMSCGNGVIKLLADADYTISYFSTLVHELSHSLLHQGYVKKSKGVNSEWAQFFIGTEQGRGMVEQQAEISAFIVLRFFGYDTLETASNYAGCWGMDAKSTYRTFDSVSQVASFIIKKIGEKLDRKDNINQGISELNNDENNFE